MGLDQYMRKKVFIGANYEHREVKGKIDITIKGEKVNIDFNKVSYIEEQDAYWRKANQIHNWFVTNVQNGNDDCGTYFISKEHFEELYNECKQVMENKNLLLNYYQQQMVSFLVVLNMMNIILKILNTLLIL